MGLPLHHPAGCAIAEVKTGSIDSKLCQWNLAMALRVAGTWLQACEHTVVTFGQSELSEFFSLAPFMFEGLHFCFLCFCVPLVLGQALALFSVIKAEGRRETFEM